MAHTQTTHGTESNDLVQTSSTEWPEIAAAAGAWWDEPVAANETDVAGVFRSAEEVPSVEPELHSSQWPGVAAAAGAWWDEASESDSERDVLRHVSAARVAGASAMAPAEWPGVAAAAGAWWDAPLASGPFSASEMGAIRAA